MDDDEEVAPGVIRWAPQGPSKGVIGLLHGVTSSASTWWRVGPILANLGWDATAVDLAGHGQGPRPEPPVDLRALAELALVKLPPRLSVLVGHSLGAAVALEAARLRPDLARGLFLEEPPGQGGIDAGALARGIEAEAAAARADRGAYWQHLRRENHGWSDADVDRAVDNVLAADTPAIVDALREDLKWDLVELARSVHLPLMVVAAPASDGLFPNTGGTALRGEERLAVQRLVPEERFVVLAGGHSLHREHPERIAELISAFALSVAA
ncbi:MAG: alpha/beta fold hydrolase [Acidimicrobiales bacterium]